jgi:hypothetical protein
MELFPFIKILFENPAEYKKLRSYEKSKFFFMTNRFLSISYPVQANQFNNIHIETDRVLDFWQRNLKSIGRVPGWIFTKTKKEKSEKVKVPSEEAIKLYLEKKGYSRKQLNQSIKILGESTYNPIFEIDSLLNSK